MRTSRPKQVAIAKTYFFALETRMHVDSALMRHAKQFNINFTFVHSFARLRHLSRSLISLSLNRMTLGTWNSFIRRSFFRCFFSLPRRSAVQTNLHAPFRDEINCWWSFLCICRWTITKSFAHSFCLLSKLNLFDSSVSFQFLFTVFNLLPRKSREYFKRLLQKTHSCSRLCRNINWAAKKSRQIMSPRSISSRTKKTKRGGSLPVASGTARERQRFYDCSLRRKLYDRKDERRMSGRLSLSDCC